MFTTPRYPFKEPYGPCDKPKRSLFYPGEAALGLIYLYESLVEQGRAEAAAVYLEGAARGLEALASEREDWHQEDIPPDHWALKATARILNHLPESRHDKLLRHAAKVIRMMHDRDLERIAMDAKLGVSSMGTVLEAQFAMLPIFHEKREPYYDNVEEAWCLAEKVAFLLCEAQDMEKPAHMLGGLPHNLQLKNENGSDGQPSVRSITGDDRMHRIDDTQHTLSAWLSYKEALGTGLADIDCSRGELPPLIDSLFDDIERRRQRKSAKSTKKRKKSKKNKKKKKKGEKAEALS